MSSPPLISIVINCYNGAQYLREAIESVFSQTTDNWEIVFWDDGSTDGSGEIAKSYGEKVRYFRNENRTNLGLSKARNKAFAECRGEFIAILDQDDIWLPNKLEKQMSLFQTNPTIGLTFSNSIFFDDKKDRYEMFQYEKPKRGNVFGDLLSRNFISTETMIYRKEAINSLPYVMDDQFNMVMDYDLSLRIAYNYDLDYVKEPLSKWRMHSAGESNKKRFEIWRECQVMLEKLCNELPDIKNKYDKQISAFKKNIDGQLAFEQWIKKNKKVAREYLLPYLNDPEYLIMFLSTFIMPFTVFDRVKCSTITKYIRALGR